MRILIQHPESKSYLLNGVPISITPRSLRVFIPLSSIGREQDIQSAFIVVKFRDAAAQDIKYAVGGGQFAPGFEASDDAALPAIDPGAQEEFARTGFSVFSRED